MKKFFVFITTFFVLLAHFPINSVEASDVDFDVTIDLLYTVRPSGKMQIKETRTIKNNSNQYFIPSSSVETFIIKSFKTRSESTEGIFNEVIGSISLSDKDGNALNPVIDTADDRIEIRIPFGNDVYQGSEKTFVLEYKTSELVEKNGAVWNIYIPGFAEGYNKIVTSDNGTSTRTTYRVILETDKKLGTANFILPEPDKTDDNGEKVSYTFDSDSLVEQSVWIQFGKNQYYFFKIVQEVKASTGVGAKVLNSWYDLVLPRESDSGNQEVFFDSITPEPKYIHKDGEGNIIVRFSFKSEEEAEIVVKGFIITSFSDQISREDVGSLNEVDVSQVYAFIDEEEITLSDLLLPQEFWEVESPEIQSKAEELKAEKENIFDILLADYAFVTDTVDYDNLKIDIDNKRQGALATLQGGSSVCMEYSDLLIALLRAQGIPTRAAFGYGYDHRSALNSQEGHQWIEVFMPNIGWVPVDPTWGDTGRKSYIGGDVDHALWYVAGMDVDSPSPVVKYAIADLNEIPPPDFEIQVVDNVDTTGLTSLNDLLTQYKKTPQHIVIETLDQLNIYGKIVFIVVPGILLFILLIIIFTWIKRIVGGSIFGMNKRYST